MHPWPSIRRRMSWPTLQIGNGASIHVSDRFHYQQLFQAAALPGPVRNVFTQLGTEDFERVLTGLWGSKNSPGRTGLAHPHDGQTRRTVRRREGATLRGSPDRAPNLDANTRRFP